MQRELSRSKEKARREIADSVNLIIIEVELF